MSEAPGSADAARERLARLIERGALGFDALGVAQVRALMAKAEALSEGAAARVRARIEERVGRLEARFESERARAVAAVEALAAEGIDAGEALREALARGEFEAVHRGCRRARDERRAGEELLPILWIPRLRAQASARGMRLSEELARGLAELDRTPGFVERRSLARASRLGNELSIRLFRDSLASARASFAMARASDNVPEAAGPYNGQALSARALAAMAELSPSYLKAFLAGLDDLETVALALSPETKKAKAPRRKRGGAAAG
jgi:hypothetical protein